MIKKVFWPLLALLAISFAGCKKDDGDGGAASAELYNTAKLLDETYEKFWELGQANNATPKQALMLTADWVETQANVASVQTFDSLYLHVTDKGGLEWTIRINVRDANGKSLFRGSDAPSSLSRYLSAGGSCSNEIKNKKVLICAAAYSEFYELAEMQRIFDHFTNHDIPFEVTFKGDQACNIQVVETFHNYGLVLLSTHGTPNMFMTGEYLHLPSMPTELDAFKDQIVQQRSQYHYDKLVAGKLSMGRTVEYDPAIFSWTATPDTAAKYYYLWVTTKQIAGQPNMDSTILFGNMCYSGYMTNDIANPIGPAILAKNPIAYYAYSHNDQSSSPVVDAFAKRMEDSLVLALLRDYDSTGVAHLKANGDEYDDYLGPQIDIYDLYLKHYSKNNFCYKFCQDTLVDARDGQVYKTICIGSQTWMGENLNYSAHDSIGVCYDSLASNCNIYGRLYSRPEMLAGHSPATGAIGVRGICPAGWHIPTNQEWAKLEIALGLSPAEANDFTTTEHGASIELGSRLMSETGWETTTDPGGPSLIYLNDSGFDAPPAGSWDHGFDPFSPPGWLTGFWTSSFHPGSTGLTYRRLHYKKAALQLWDSDNGGFNYRWSCRCVKD